MKNILFYGCANDEDNQCKHITDCKRYLSVKNKNIDELDICYTTLYRFACTKENDYQLFMRNDFPIIKKEEQNA